MDEESGVPESLGEDEVPLLDGEGDLVESTGKRSRRRVLTFSIAGAAAAIGIVVLSAVVIAQAGSNPVASPSPSETPTPTVTASPTPSPSPVELVAAPDLGSAFPDAYLVNEDVWEQAGPGWGIETFSMEWSITDIEDLERRVPGAVYLVSPDEDYYLIRSFEGAESVKGLYVLSWREDTNEVIIAANTMPDPGIEHTERAYVLHEGETTAVDSADLGFPGYSVFEPLLVAADGSELWRGYKLAEDYQRIYVRWTPSSGYKLAAIQPLVDSVYDVNVASYPDPSKIREDGQVVMLESHADRDSYLYSRDGSYVAYDVVHDAVFPIPDVQPGQNADGVWCGFVDWTETPTLAFECSLSAKAWRVPVAVPGLSTTGASPSEFFDSAGDESVGRLSRIDFGEAAHREALLPPCGC